VDGLALALEIDVREPLAPSNAIKYQLAGREIERLIEVAAQSVVVALEAIKACAAADPVVDVVGRLAAGATSADDDVVVGTAIEDVAAQTAKQEFATSSAHHQPGPVGGHEPAG